METETVKESESVETQTVKPPIGEPIQVDSVVDVSAIAKRNRPRNYSFMNKKADSLDAVEVNGVSYPIPAAMGSTYWAILKVCYEHANSPVYPEQLLVEVETLMIDRDPKAWETYCGKQQTTVFKKGEQKSGIQDIKSWKERLINNAKTLTRLGGTSQYGMRLFERGHVLRYTNDGKKKPCFILYTSTDVLKGKGEDTKAS
jgi:hypothetical protein